MGVDEIDLLIKDGTLNSSRNTGLIFLFVEACRFSSAVGYVAARVYQENRD